MAAGRPSNYREEYAELARKLCLLGATDAEMAAIFEVSTQTLNAWKNAHPKFLDALKMGKDHADALVADRLFNRAMGYSHKAVKIFADVKTGQEKIIEYVEHYPPDTTACIFWLKNRQRAKWRDKPDDEGEKDGGITIVVKGGLPE